MKNKLTKLVGYIGLAYQCRYFKDQPSELQQHHFWFTGTLIQFQLNLIFQIKINIYQKLQKVESHLA